ncbi:MAG: copper amine oxidase N-terminal domain-containing protein [Oscillospiraceae bacterium]|nr:copper amine oxidase N-terminal domain-containing protein [Oscillospiraceae bacterium]
MKKTLSVLLAMLMLMSSFCIVASADSEIDIFIDGIKLQCDKAPYIENGRTMVPMRKIFESLDSTVEWEGSTQTITATKGDTQIVLQIGRPTLYKNGVAEELDVSPIIKDGSTFVPARAVAQALGTKVDWFGESSTVFITSKDTNAIKDFPAIILPDWDELEVVEDPYGGEYSYAIYSGKDEMVDENIPKT